MFPEKEVIDSLPTTTFKAGRANVENFMDLSRLEQMPMPGNQYNQGSCVGWVLGYALKTYQERLETGDNSLFFSPSFIYNTVKSPYSNCSEGITFEKAFEFLKDRGCCRFDDMPYKPSDCRSLPSSFAYKDAKRYKIKDFKKIYASTASPITDLSEIEQQITFKNPVIIGVWIDSYLGEYMDDVSPNKEKKVWQENLRDTDIKSNYHAMLCIGYDKVAKEFKVLNSYGPDSAYHGYVFISYNAFRQSVYEAYYTTDANNYGKFENAKRQSNQQEALNLAGVNNYNDHLKLKEGYFIDVNYNLRLSCTFLSKSEYKASFNLIDITNNENKVIGSYLLSKGDEYQIKYNSELISFKLIKIGRWGYYPFKAAAFLDLKIEKL